MSQTNSTYEVCSRCKSIVAPYTGTVRYWNGAARRHAPKYATKNPVGVLSACHCLKCERELEEARKIKNYNRRHGFT